jgi:hypothetical protein
MKRPSAPGTAIDAKRYKRWTSRFGSYRNVTTDTIGTWLDQFDDNHRDLAARVLDSVDFFGQSNILAAYRQALQALPGWDATAARQTGKWRFAAMSGSAGESGDAMLYQFRLANGLDSKRFHDLFVGRTDLFRLAMLPDNDPQKLGKNDVVVLLDDFSGTGQQVCDAWNGPETSFGALLAGVGHVYLILVAASTTARKRIIKETSISPFPAHELRESDDVFSDHCTHFTKSDKANLLHYCRIADRQLPMGRGNCGFVVVFQHRTPNNSIPILHREHSRWTGLFPRHE